MNDTMQSFHRMFSSLPSFFLFGRYLVPLNNDLPSTNILILVLDHTVHQNVPTNINVPVPPSQNILPTIMADPMTPTRRRPERTPGLVGTNAAFLVPEHIRKKFADGRTRSPDLPDGQRMPTERQTDRCGSPWIVIHWQRHRSYSDVFKDIIRCRGIRSDIRRVASSLATSPWFD